MYRCKVELTPAFNLQNENTWNVSSFYGCEYFACKQKRRKWDEILITRIWDERMSDSSNSQSKLTLKQVDYLHFTVIIFLQSFHYTIHNKHNLQIRIIIKLK